MRLRPRPVRMTVERDLVTRRQQLHEEPGDRAPAIRERGPHHDLGQRLDERPERPRPEALDPHLAEALGSPVGVLVARDGARAHPVLGPRVIRARLETPEPARHRSAFVEAEQRVVGQWQGAPDGVPKQRPLVRHRTSATWARRPVRRARAVRDHDRPSSSGTVSRAAPAASPRGRVRGGSPARCPPPAPPRPRDRRRTS